MGILYILAMLLLFSASIFVHELGHFLAARAFGMVADVFSIGMGPALWKRKIGATTYKIGWIFFGGYVALPQMDPNSFLEGTGDEGEEGTGDEGRGLKSETLDPRPSTLSTPRPAPRALPPVSAWKKIVVSVAGAFGNVVFAFVLATVVWWVGKPSSLQERCAVVGYVATNSPALALGLAPGDELVAVDGQPVANWQQVVEKTALGPAREVVLRYRPVGGEGEREISVATEKTPMGVWMLPGIDGVDPCHVASVYPNSGAEAAGLQPGDQLLRFDGHDVYSRAHLSQLVEAAAGRPALLEFRRGGELLSAEVESSYDEKLGRHLIGIQFNTLADLDYAALSHPTPWAQVKGHAAAIFDFLRALVTPATSGAAAEAVGGPVLILMMLWLMLKSSFILAVWFTGFLNVNLAIINLLPLPLLDGGHVVMNLWAGITRRPASPRLINALANAFAVLFIALFLTLTFRDSVRHLVPTVRHWFADDARAAAVPAVFEDQPAPAEPAAE
ncbi:MAG TPA: site-2 protease family protein [Kiritimatiellia bacterium]|nr:site-2 protease family protein [Kiritimatiellia bacterium]